MSIESVMSSSHLILCCPLLLLPSIPPSIRVFSNESTLRMRWPKYWSFSFSISPSNEHPGLIFRRCLVGENNLVLRFLPAQRTCSQGLAVPKLCLLGTFRAALTLYKIQWQEQIWVLDFLKEPFAYPTKLRSISICFKCRIFLTKLRAWGKKKDKVK